jgi:hypothetical protein
MIFYLMHSYNEVELWECVHFLETNSYILQNLFTFICITIFINVFLMEFSFEKIFNIENLFYFD